MPGTPASLIQPLYSHGGTTSGTWTAVSGQVTGGGRPVYIGNMPVNVAAAGLWPAMNIYCVSGTATVKIEGNPGPITFTTTTPPSSPTLPSTGWVDLTDGGISMNSADSTSVASKICPPEFLYFRTNITVISGATITSLMGNAPWFLLSYPPSS